MKLFRVFVVGQLFGLCLDTSSINQVHTSNLSPQNLQRLSTGAQTLQRGSSLHLSGLSFPVHCINPQTILLDGKPASKTVTK